MRTLDKKEIDFIVTCDNQPLLAVEVKSSNATLSRPLINRHKWFPDAPTIGIQVVNQRGVLQKYPDRTWVMSCEKLLSLLA